jgi:hypothetical protein
MLLQGDRAAPAVRFFPELFVPRALITAKELSRDKLTQGGRNGNIESMEKLTTEQEYQQLRTMLNEKQWRVESGDSIWLPKLNAEEAPAR